MKSIQELLKLKKKVVRKTLQEFFDLICVTAINPIIKITPAIQYK
ncbi:hypothetical protein [Francisella philomiragia]|nr:hypothetical protein [Francisella philomiragia]